MQCDGKEVGDDGKVIVGVSICPTSQDSGITDHAL